MKMRPAIAALVWLAACVPGLDGDEEAGETVASPDGAPGLTDAAPDHVAFANVAMVEAAATRPPRKPDPTGWGFDVAEDPCAGASAEIARYGAGVIVAREAGYVFLAVPEHVVFPCHWPPYLVEVRFRSSPGQVFVGETLDARDAELDLAVIRVAETDAVAAALDGQGFVRVRSPHALRAGDRLQTIGNPEGNAWYLNPFGLDVFDRLDDDVVGFHARLLTTGNSGGALYTEDWYLVGMVLSERLPFGRALAVDRLARTLGEWGVPVALEVPPPPPEPLPRGRDCPECPELVEVPAGSFMMGADPQEPESLPDELPRHEVTIARPFLMGAHEVTVAQFGAFIRDSGYRPGTGCEVWSKGNFAWKDDREKSWSEPGYPIVDDRRPVVCVSWEEAQAYVAWISRKTGKKYRLPSEAEWEYAARSSTTTIYWWGDHFPSERAVCADCGTLWDRDRPAPVGSFAANFYGLHDVNGNVWEWVEDCWHKGYEGAPDDGSPWIEGGDCAKRARRGGSLMDPFTGLRSANRHQDHAVNRKSDIGFRVARDLD